MVSASPIALSHGPALIGAAFMFMLLGSAYTQAFTYAVRFPRDPSWIKCIVAVLLVCDTLGSVFILKWLFDCLILDFGNVPALFVADWFLASDPALIAIGGAISQMFFAWRIRVLTGKMWLSAMVVILALCSGLSGIGVAIGIGMVKDFTKFPTLDPIVTVWLISTAACDVCITAILSVYLHSRRTGFRQTNDVLNRILRLTVQNGSITSTFALLELGFFLGLPNTGLHIGASFILSKLYSNCVLSTLNARRSSGGDVSTDQNIEINSMGLRTDGGTRHGTRIGAQLSDSAGLNGDPKNMAATPSVFVQVETHLDEPYKRDPESLGYWAANPTKDVV